MTIIDLELTRCELRRPSGQRIFPTPLREPKWAQAVRESSLAKHTKISIETDSLVLRGRMSLRASCPQCGTESEVEAWIQSEHLHHAKASDDAHLICLNSMLKRVAETTTFSRGDAEQL